MDPVSPLPACHTLPLTAHCGYSVKIKCLNLQVKIHSNTLGIIHKNIMVTTQQHAKEAAQLLKLNHVFQERTGGNIKTKSGVACVNMCETR